MFGGKALGWVGRGIDLDGGRAGHTYPLGPVAQGRHVAPVMKALRVDCAVYGNHDFDFGPDELVKLAKDCGMPWVMTNVVDTRKGRGAACAPPWGGSRAPVNNAPPPGGGGGGPTPPTQPGRPAPPLLPLQRLGQTFFPAFTQSKIFSGAFGAN